MIVTTVNPWQMLIDRFARARVLVIGDIIVDRYLFGNASRISPEAPVPVVDIDHTEIRLGGAANVFNNVHTLGGRATLCGVVGADAMGDHVLDTLRDMMTPTDGVVRTSARRTTLKTRIIAQHQQVVRYDQEDRNDVEGEDLERFFQFFDARLDDFDAVIVSDYIKGVVGQGLMDRIAKHRVHNGGKPLVVDPKPRKPERFVGATVITPNQREAELMAGVKITDAASLNAVGNKLLGELRVKAVLITRGAKGMTLFEPEKEAVEIPTAAKNVFDVTGAGDTAVAALTLGLVVGLSMFEAAKLANVAAGVVVGKVGTETITPQELMRSIVDDESGCS